MHVVHVVRVPLDINRAVKAFLKSQIYCYCVYTFIFLAGYIWCILPLVHVVHVVRVRGEGLGSRPKKMYGERLGDGVEYHLMSPTPRR